MTVYKPDCHTCADRTHAPDEGDCKHCQEGGVGRYRNWKPALRTTMGNPTSLNADGTVTFGPVEVTPKGHIPPRQIPAPAAPSDHELEDAFREVETRHAAASALDKQVGGDHYKKLGAYQPWEVLKHWLTEEEFRGYMKGTAIAYLARERDKGGMQDIEKSGHTLAGLVEMAGRK